MAASQFSWTPHDAPELPWEEPEAKVLILGARECQQVYPMSLAIQSQFEAFSAVQNGSATDPARILVPIPNTERDISLFKPSLNSEFLSIKNIHVRPNNTSQNLPTHTGSICLFDTGNGLPLCVMDAVFVTGRRTAAGSGVATVLFSNPDSSVLTVFGAGTQGKEHIRAILCVRRIKKVFLINRTVETGNSVCAGFQTVFPDVEFEAVGLSDVSEGRRNDVISEADIICTCTRSNLPEGLFSSTLVKLGCHINAVGSFTRDMQELDPNLVSSSAVVIDSEKALEVGEFKFSNPENCVVGTLGEFTNNLDSEKINEIKNKTTIFKSVGISVQDLFASMKIYKNAQEKNIGTII